MEFFSAITIFAFILGFTTTALAGDTDFTSEELKALAAFRPLVNSLLYQDFMKEDYYLVRYLRVANLDVEKAKQRLIKTIEWRKAERIDNIYSENFSQVAKCTPSYWIGHDREGRPVIYLPFGRWDVRRCVLAGYSDKMLRYLVAQQFEGGERRVFNATHPSGKKVAKVYFISDLAGFNARTGACLRCIPFTASLTNQFDTYYPGLVYRASLINVGPLFENALTVFRPFLTKENADILRLYGPSKDKWGPVLARDMDTDQLPIALGGNRRLS